MAEHVKVESLSAEEALSKLKQGNEKYLNAATGTGDI